MSFDIPHFEEHELCLAIVSTVAWIAVNDFAGRLGLTGYHV
jgi:hypothetical protein